MPPRSPKMKRFIFGFQRRVWWPKWTPASRSSFIVISTANGPPHGFDACDPPERKEHRYAGSVPAVYFDRCPVARTPNNSERRLTLRELEALAGALLPVLLALAHPRVARQKTVFAQAVAQLWVKERERPRKPHAHGAGLPACAAT